MYKKKTIGRWTFMSQRQRMSPFPNYMSMEAVSSTMKRFIGKCLDSVLLIFQGNIMYGFVESKSSTDVGRYVADQVHKNTTLYDTLVKLEKIYGSALVKFTKWAHAVVNNKITQKQLYSLVCEYEKLYNKVYAVYGSIWSMEDHLSGDLYNIIEKYEKDPERISDALNVLTKQTDAMVSSLERREMLILGKKVLSHARWARIVHQKDILLVQRVLPLKKLISAHVKKYFWITRDYEDPVLTFKDVVEKLSHFTYAKAKKEYLMLAGRFKEDKKKMREYTRRYPFTKMELKLFSAMRDAAYLKELRKSYVSESLHYFDKILAEIGRRLGLSIKQVRFMRREDLKSALLNGEDLTSELNARMKLSAWITKSRKGTKVFIGTVAQKLYTRLCTIDKNATILTGMVASPGKARGKVKIVLNPDECDKVKKGDIIVSIQVVPSFSSAILRAAGIICDGGHGITSHPAT